MSWANRQSATYGAPGSLGDGLGRTPCIFWAISVLQERWVVTLGRATPRGRMFRKQGSGDIKKVLGVGGRDSGDNSVHAIREES